MGKRLSGKSLKSAAMGFAIAMPIAVFAADFETPPVLNAPDLAAGIALSGAEYSLSNDVQTDGFMAHFSISSPYGNFSAFGPGMLETRLNEIRAIAALEHLKNDDQFKEAASKTAGDTLGNLRNLAENPQETIKGIPEGVGRFFNRTGRTLKTGLQKVEDTRQGRLPGVDATTTSNLPGGPATPITGPRPSFAEVIAKAGGDVAVNILGFDTHRRRLAKELAVDPYTTNQVLADHLDDVTWAAFAGGLGVNLVTSLIPGGMIISVSSQLTDWVWDTAPGDLRVEIENTLKSVGATGEEIDVFLRHHWYTLSMQGVLASSLRKLDGVAGQVNVLPLAVSVGSEGQARFVVQSVEMLKNYHLNQEPLAKLEIQGTIIGHSQSGAIIVVAPVDYLSWGPVVHQFAGQFDMSSDAPHMIYVSGIVSDQARDALAGLGWQVEQTSELGPIEYPVQ